jgi:hypothetical protein
MVEQKAFLFSGSESWNNTKDLNALLEEGYVVVHMSEPQTVNNKLTILVVVEREYDDCDCDCGCDCNCEKEAAE